MRWGPLLSLVKHSQFKMGSQLTYPSIRYIRKLVLLNEGNYSDMAQSMSYAKFTGHLPPNLDYMSWAKYNIFSE